MSVIAIPKLPNKPTKPYIQPDKREKKAMTIAAGFRCSDGIVLCADSQITAADGTKYNAEKLIGYSNDDIDVIFAFAGVEVFSKMCIERLARRILTSEVSNVEQVLRDEVLNIHQIYAPQATSSTTEYDLDVLVGIKFRLQNRDVLALFHIEGPAVSPAITTFDCIGIGRTVARQAINVFYKPQLSVQEASRVAVHCLQQTKTNVDGCGGPSQIITIWDDTEDADFQFAGASVPYRMEQEFVGEIEQGFTSLFESLRPVFLSFNTSNPHDRSFEKYFKKAATDIRKMRNKTFGKVTRKAKKEQEELERFIAEHSKPKTT
jgi:hypothetical protein